MCGIDNTDYRTMRLREFRGAGPQKFIMGNWLPQNQLTMVIIPPLPPSVFSLLSPFINVKKKIDGITMYHFSVNPCILPQTAAHHSGW